MAYNPDLPLLSEKQKEILEFNNYNWELCKKKNTKLKELWRCKTCRKIYINVYYDENGNRTRVEENENLDKRHNPEYSGQCYKTKEDGTLKRARHQVISNAGTMGSNPAYIQMAASLLDDSCICC
jgi:hypothetical protein